MTRVLVCGGHKNVDPRKVCAWLEACLTIAVATRLKLDVRNVRISAIIEGNADGADEGAGMYAIAYGIPHGQFPADWLNHGLNAGPIRNRRMLLEGLPDIVIAFPGKSGTANMVAQAENVGCPVFIVKGNFEYDRKSPQQRRRAYR